MLLLLQRSLQRQVRFGAGVGEIVAGLMPEPANGIEYTDAEKLKIRNIGKLVSERLQHILVMM